MPNWVRTIDIKDVWKGEDVSLIARTLAERLKALKHYNLSDCPSRPKVMFLNDKLQEFVEEFESLGANPEATTDAFDDILGRLYDFGDRSLTEGPLWTRNKALWIATNF